jgi:hypothetical protein
VLGHARGIAQGDGAQQREPAALEFLQLGKALGRDELLPDGAGVVGGKIGIDGARDADRAVQPDKSRAYQASRVFSTRSKA